MTDETATRMFTVNSRALCFSFLFAFLEHLQFSIDKVFSLYARNVAGRLLWFYLTSGSLSTLLSNTITYKLLPGKYVSTNRVDRLKALWSDITIYSSFKLTARLIKSHAPSMLNKSMQHKRAAPSEACVNTLTASFFNSANKLTDLYDNMKYNRRRNHDYLEPI